MSSKSLFAMFITYDRYVGLVTCGGSGVKYKIRTLPAPSVQKLLSKLEVSSEMSIEFESLRGYLRANPTTWLVTGVAVTCAVSGRDVYFEYLFFSTKLRKMQYDN